MPNINPRSFEVEPGAAPRPVEGGASAYEATGRHIEAQYAQAGQAIGGAISQVGQQYVEHEKNLDAIEQANYFAHKQEAITQRLAAARLTSDPKDPNYLDPHDPDAVSKLLDGLDSGDTDFQGKLRTEAGANAFASKNADFRARAFDQTVTEQTTLAAKDMLGKTEDTIQTLHADAYQNPTNTLANIAQIEALKPAMPAGTEAEMARAQRETAKQGALGLIDNSTNPLKAVEVAKEKFGQYLGEALPELQNHAIAMDRAHRQDIEMQHTLFKQHQSDVSEARTSQYLDVIGKNGGQMPADFATQILKDNSLLPSARVSLVDFGKRAAESTIPPNPALTSSFLARAGLPANDPKVLTYDDVVNQIDRPGGLTQAEGSFVLGIMKGPDAAMQGQAMAAVDSLISGTVDPKGGFGASLFGDGQQKSASAKLALLQHYQAGLGQGWSWQSMLLPGGQHYIPTPEFLATAKGQSGSFAPLIAPTSPAAPKTPPANRPPVKDILFGK